MLKLMLLVFVLALLGEIAVSQTAKQSKRASKATTVRVHIDGFMKSKSGAT